MISEVVLHIGMHKTGTTAIQYCLKNYDDGSIRMARLSDVNHSVPIFSLFSEDRYQYLMHKSLGRGEDEIDSYNRTAKSALENELALTRDKLIISGEDISLLKKAEVSNLVSYLKEHATRVRVIAYVRAPNDFASSALQQYIQGGMRKAQLPTPQYKKRFSAFLESSADVVEFVEFKQTKLHKECVLHDFCKRISLDSSSLNYASQNSSVSLECVQLLYHFNQHGMPSSGSPLLRETRRLFILDLANNMNKTKFMLPQELLWNQQNIEDSRWMESVSDIKILPEGIEEKTCLNPELADNQLHDLLSTIDYSTLTRLQAVVSAFDSNIGKECKVTNLLNFLFSQQYAAHKRHLQSRVMKRNRLRRLRNLRQRQWSFRMVKLLARSKNKWIRLWA